VTALGEHPELRSFVDGDGRLLRVPRRRAPRLVLLDALAQSFELGQHYAEAEVNDALRAVFDDVATLRRLLVDEGFLDRDSGWYWRSGGSVSPT
jgi:hypothetical protein